MRGVCEAPRSAGRLVLRGRRWAVVACLGAAGVLASVSVARAGGPASAVAGGSGDDALAWLQRIQDAAQSRNYKGVFAVSRGGVISSTRVTHFCEGRERYERVEALSGPAHVQYRHNDQQVTVWQADRLAVVGARDPVPDFPALSPLLSPRLLEHYDVQKTGTDRIAGLDAEVYLLKPRDQDRFAQRLWAERETGLLLRGDVLGPRSEVLESTSFTELSLASRSHGAADTVLKPMKRLDGLRVLSAPVVKTQLEAEGWWLKRGGVPGFQLVSCSRRPLDAAHDDPAQVALQAVFTDGLAGVSVFIEPHDPKRHKAMRTVLGATHSLTTRRGDWWVTLVGEVPLATLQQFESQLERRR